MMRVTMFWTYSSKQVVDGTYFWFFTCLMWWNTLMTSRIRRGASSIFDAKHTHPMAVVSMGCLTNDFE